jgi:hypothetical protein
MLQFPNQMQSVDCYQYKRNNSHTQRYCHMNDAVFHVCAFSYISLACLMCPRRVSQAARLAELIMSDRSYMILKKFFITNFLCADILSSNVQHRLHFWDSYLKRTFQYPKADRKFVV